MSREPGDGFVTSIADMFSMLTTNKLDGLCLATPAIADGNIFYRTTEKLLAIGSLPSVPAR